MRISQLPLDKWDPELRQMTQIDSASSIEKMNLSMFAHAPHIPKAMGAFMGTAMAAKTLPARLMEIVRLRVAFHNQCRSCMAMRFQSAVDDGVTEDVVCSLEKPSEASDLTDREKAALAYADLFATNHLAIGDDMFENLRKHFTEAEIVELAGFVAFWVAFGRLGAVMNGLDALPIGFQDKSKKIAPWQVKEAVVVRG